MNRREFIQRSAAIGASVAVGETIVGKEIAAKPLFELALSQWAFRRAILGNARDDNSKFIETLHRSPDAVLLGEMDPRDIVVRARELGVDYVDLVNILWFGHGKDAPWLKEFKRRAANEGVGFGVLMCDELGKIGAEKKADRDASVARHVEWLETAAELGCLYLRVNAYGDGNYLEQCRRSSESLHRLGEASMKYGVEILVENHGHPGSNGAWLAMLMEMANHPRVGTYTDFDNFFMGGWGLNPERRYDRLQGMLDLAPYTRAVSAKSHDLGTDGEETTINFNQCLRTLLDEGFRGLVCAEHEGTRLSEYEGSRLTIELLKRERKKLESEYDA